MKKKFKIFLFLFLLTFLYTNIYSQQYWYRVSSPTNKTFRRCHFPDSVHGWIVGDSGVIVHTSNRGDTWILQNSTIGLPIEDVFFLNERLGWCIANDYFYNGTYIIKTTNGGANWLALQYPDSTFFINTIFYVDSLTGFFGGFGSLYGGLIFRTSNGGLDWTRCQVDSSACSFLPILKFDIKGVYGLACGGIFDIQGAMWASTNGGLRWKTQCVGPEPVFNIMWLDSTFAIGTGGDPEFGASLVRTSDAGDTWLYDTTGKWGIGQNLAFRTPADVWVPLGFSFRWAHSTDSTKTWTEVVTLDTTELYATVFLDSLLGWTFGDTGAIFKFDTSMIGITKNQNNIPQQTGLLQNYPNPFNPRTTIRFEVHSTARVRIVLYDLLGRELRLLTDEFRRPGIYTISFSAEGLSSGVYFYRLQAGTFSEAKKMVVLK
jgi:photosystem II stability/assembly factor-like uncharacterized protein